MVNMCIERMFSPVDGLSSGGELKFDVLKNIPSKLDDQPLMKMDEKERNFLAYKTALEFVSTVHDFGFKVEDFSVRGKSEDSIKLKEFPVCGGRREKPIFDLIGIRFVFDTDEEIDGFINWTHDNFYILNNYVFDSKDNSWIKDFRKEKVKDLYKNPHMQSDYKAVHLRIPYVYEYDNGEEFCDYLEIQLVAKQQYEINKKNRSDYEKSRKSARLSLK